MEKVSEANLIVAVREPPVKGRANAAIQKALAEYFKVSASQVVLVSGFSSKNKIFEIKGQAAGRNGDPSSRAMLTTGQAKSVISGKIGYVCLVFWKNLI